MSLRVPAVSNRYLPRKPSNRILFSTSTVVVNRREELCDVVYTKNTGSTILDPNAALQQPGSLHDPYTLNKIISSCAEMGWLSTGVQIHCNAVKLGFNSNVYINTSLVNMYGKCAEILLARTLFEEMPYRNDVTWNALVSGYVKACDPVTAIELLIKMLRENVPVTPFGVSAALAACAQLEDHEIGAQVHGMSLKGGFQLNFVVGNGLIDMHAKCGDMDKSRKVFERLVDKNIVAWTSMITGYAHNHNPDKAMILIREMSRSGLKANDVTYNSLLSSFYSPDDLVHCKQIHCRIIREGLDSDTYLATTLVIVYSDCGCSLGDYNKICSCVTQWDQVAWNAVIAGFSSLGKGEEAFICFSRMRQEGITVDLFTFSSVLKALGKSLSLEEGKQVHALISKTSYMINVNVQNGLVSMYARCGLIGDAKTVFYLMEEHDFISWNSLITGCAQHGYGTEAIQIFEKMRQGVIKPNSTTFLAVLTACSHVGLIEKGLGYFDQMKSDGLLSTARLEHYACVVDLYGRAGLLYEAEAFINCMHIEEGPSVYKALLSSCQVHHNTEIAVRSAGKLVELCPNDPATYVLLANVLATEGNWDDAANIRKLILDKRVGKRPGFSYAMK